MPFRIRVGIFARLRIETFFRGLAIAVFVIGALVFALYLLGAVE